MGWWAAVWHWLVHVTGCDYGAPYGHFVFYNFWSGIAGSFLVGLSVWSAGFWWHNQCSVHHCWWYARRTTAAGERACWRHTPERKRTVQDIHKAHWEARSKNPA